MQAMTIIATKTIPRATRKIWGVWMDHEATSYTKLGLSSDHQIEPSVLGTQLVTCWLANVNWRSGERASVPSSYWNALPDVYSEAIRMAFSIASDAHSGS